MIKLSNGVEISEDTVVSALKKAGIKVEPKHIFKAGDVAYFDGDKSVFCWRFIVKIKGKLYSINCDGTIAGKLQGQNQEYFEINDYKYVGRQSDLLKSS